MHKNSQNRLLFPTSLFSLAFIFYLFLILNLSNSVVIKIKKQYVYIPYNSQYIFKLIINQTQSQINPVKVAIYHQIYNTLATTNQYFDYFKYLSKQDIECYSESIGNSSYLYPCPFILNGDQLLRTYDAADQIQNQNQTIKGLNVIQQTFIVDNTPYPFPAGAYPYTSLQISSSASLTVSFNDQYKQVGIRLIFITATLLIIYTFIIGILVYRTHKIQKQMLQRKPDYKLKRRASQLSKQNGDIKQQDQQSDIDNFDRIVHHQLANSRQSRGSRDYRDRQCKIRSGDLYPNKQLMILEVPQHEGSVNPIQKIDL